jgi:hypothetical protein
MTLFEYLRARGALRIQEITWVAGSSQRKYLNISVKIREAFGIGDAPSWRGGSFVTLRKGTKATWLHFISKNV